MYIDYIHTYIHPYIHAKVCHIRYQYIHITYFDKWCITWGVFVQIHIHLWPFYQLLISTYHPIDVQSHRKPASHNCTRLCVFFFAGCLRPAKLCMKHLTTVSQRHLKACCSECHAEPPSRWGDVSCTHKRVTQWFENLSFYWNPLYSH